mgnify:CR=1 FL=1
MEINKELVVVKKQVMGANEAAQGLTINSQPKLEEAKIVLQKIGVAKKFVKGKKDEIVKPMKEALDKVKDLFAPLENMIIEAEEMVKIKMLGYNRILQAEEEKRRLTLEAEARKLAEEEAKKKPNEIKIEAVEKIVEKAVEKVEAIIEKREAIPTRKNKVLEIVDENLIPDKYWKIDLVKLREDVITNGLEVAGAKVVIEESIINYV